MKQSLRSLKTTDIRRSLIDRLTHVDLYRRLTQMENETANTHTNTGQHTSTHIYLLVHKHLQNQMLYLKKKS